MEEIKTMLQALSNSVSTFDAQIAAIQSALATLPTSPTDPVSTEGKIYTQADLDAAVSAAVLPLQAEIASLKQQIDDVNAGVSKQVAAGVAAVKAELAAKYAELQVAEQSAETGFAELLK